MKTWFITGATGGLATDVVKRLLENGDRVAATTRHAEEMNGLKQQYADQLWISEMDLNNPDDIKSVVNSAFKHFETIDVLLNNAAYGLYGAVEEISDTQMHQMFNINVFGSINVAKAMLPHFRQQFASKIIQISSMAGQFSGPAMGLYSASKAAIESSFEALAAEVAPFNVETIIVEPGGIRTKFAAGNGVVAKPLTVYQDSPARHFTDIINQGSTLANFTEEQIQEALKSIAGDPDKMAQAIIKRADEQNGPLRMPLGSDSYTRIIEKLEAKLAAFKATKKVAYSTDANDYKRI